MTADSIEDYELRLNFYLKFHTGDENREPITDIRLGNYDHLLAYLGW